MNEFQQAKSLRVEPRMINGRYLLHEEIGSGGMGIVYRATDRLTGDIVALKQITTSLASIVDTSYHSLVTEDALRLALTQEFQILARLHHPHIVGVLDYGFDANKEPYFTMDYLPQAETLLDVGKTADIDRKIDLIGQVLQALAYLHRHGVLHKDIKPNNILVSNGRAYLLDFGLSASNKQHSALSGGTQLYMSPEVYHNIAPYTSKSDLYSMGVVMYQLCTGNHPFDDLTLEQNISPIDSCYSFDQIDLPPAVIHFLQTLLQKDPNMRYKDGLAALSALHQALGSEQAENPEIRESFLQAASFVGREKELVVLKEALDNAKNNKGSAWLIGGESGVGKSRLLDEIRIHALIKGMLVLRGQQQNDTGAPLQLWNDPIRRLLLHTEVDDLATSILQKSIPHISHILNRQVTELPKLDSKAEQQRLFSTILRLFRQQQQPILLILEDLQWASTSLELIKLLTQLVGELPLVVIGNYRNDEAPKLAEALPDMHVIQLERLSKPMIAQLSTAVLGETGQQSHIISWLQSQTEGNAFFLVELIRALAEEVGRLDDISKLTLPETLLPQGIQSIVQRRIDKVSAKGRSLLQIAAVAGRQLDLRLLGRLAIKGLDIKHQWLVEANDAAVLDIQDGIWQFTHDKIREHILANLAPQLLQHHHLQIATAYVSLYGDKPNQAAILSNHYLGGGDKENAYRYAVEAGHYAAQKYAHEDAIIYFNRAISLHPENAPQDQFELVLARLEIYFRKSSQEALIYDLSLLDQLAKQLGYQAKIEVALQKSRHFRAIGKPDQAERQAEIAIELAQQNDDKDGEAQGWYAFGSSRYKRGDSIKAGKSLSKSLEICQQLNNDKLITDNLEALTNNALLRGDLDQAEHYLNQLNQYKNILPRVRIAYLMLSGHVNMYRGKTEEAINLYKEGLKLCRQLGLVILEGKMLGSLAVTYDKCGQWQDARQYYEMDILLQKETGEQQELSLILYNLGNLLLRTGLGDEGVSLLHQSLSLLENVQELRIKSACLTRLGIYYREQEDINQAINYFDQASEIAHVIQLPSLELDALQGLVWTFIQQQVFDKAQSTLDTIVTSHRKLPTTYKYNLTLAQGIIRYSQRDSQDAQALFANAVAGLQNPDAQLSFEHVLDIKLKTIYLGQLLGKPEQVSHLLDEVTITNQQLADNIQDPIWKQAFLENGYISKELTRLHHFSYA